MTANTDIPGFNPSSSTTLLAIEDVITVPPTSTRTSAVICPLTTSAIVPFSTLRALTFIVNPRTTMGATKAPLPPIEEDARAIVSPALRSFSPTSMRMMAHAEILAVVSELGMDDRRRGEAHLGYITAASPASPRSTRPRESHDVTSPESRNSVGRDACPRVLQPKTI